MIPSRPHSKPPLEIEIDNVAAGRTPGCGYTCDCHGGYVCIRAEHPHDPDADMGPGKPRGNVAPHIGLLPDGNRVSWCGPCPPELTDKSGAPVTAEQMEQHAAAERAAALEALIASVGAEALAAALAPHLLASDGERVGRT